LSARLLATLLVLAALGVRFFVAVPAQAEAAAAGDAFRRARDERRDVDRRLEGAARRDARRQRAQALVAAARAALVAQGDPVTDLRRDVVASVREIGVSRVELGVRPARSPLAASLQLSAVGSLEDASGLLSDLTTRRGLILERVRLEPQDDGRIRVDLDGGRLLGGP
jgi:hypothetical protein